MNKRDLIHAEQLLPVWSELAGHVGKTKNIILLVHSIRLQARLAVAFDVARIDLRHQLFDAIRVETMEKITLDALGEVAPDTTENREKFSPIF